MTMTMMMIMMMKWKKVQLLAIICCYLQMMLIGTIPVQASKMTRRSDSTTSRKSSDTRKNKKNGASSSTTTKTRNLCNCNTCTDDILDRIVVGHSCRDRIQYMMNELAFEEYDACARIGGIEFPYECGLCNPKSCNNNNNNNNSINEEIVVDDNDGNYDKKDYFCGCETCTIDAWNTMTSDFTSCGARISYLTDVMQMRSSDACALVGSVQFQDECGMCNPTTCGGGGGGESAIDVVKEVEGKTPAIVDATIDGLRCGCIQCHNDDTVWNFDADGFTCGNRIEWLIQNEVVRYPTVKDACHQVANVEFNEQCGGCDPSKCNTKSDRGFDVTDYSESTGTAVTTPATTFANNVDAGFSDMTLGARTPLYCFPEFEDRARYRNMWGKYTMEIKESNEVCGPSNNRFGRETVDVIDEHHLKLQFKKVNGFWQASEVRVRLPQDKMPFHYGKYSFSVKSVEMIDSFTGSLVSKVLPPSLVLGLFTWDSTEDYSTHENYNHEVDIEVSQWNIWANEDLQFLVQPASNSESDPHLARFYSGGGTSYSQGQRKFDFQWSPAKIEFFGDRGESHTYSAQDAIRTGTPDYTQCLPADVEIRMNLWNILGTGQPTHMEDHHVVEVVIDGFHYNPSGLTSLADSETCTKHCQCASSSLCIDNTCQPSNSRRNLVDETRSIEYKNKTVGQFVRRGLSEQRVSFALQIVLGVSVAISIGAAVLIHIYRPLWAFPGRGCPKN